MARADLVSPRSFSWPFRNPWPFLLAGLGMTLLAMTFQAMLPARGAPNGWPVARVVLVVLGLTCAGSAVSLRLQSAAWDVDARFRSAGILALAALASLVAIPALDADWDSARLVLAVLTGLALAGAVLVLLPTTLRKIAVSLLLLYHFGGILTAVTSVAVPNHPPPWLTVQLWTRLYRPYLQFMYLNNAYHFYSPDPGPPILLWFYVQYSDGSGRWVEVPRREDFRTKVEYQRRLALTESTNMPQGPPAHFEALLRNRLMAAEHHRIPLVPFHLMPPVAQYREPTSYSKKMLSSYARHVARNYPSENDPSADVTGVKVYRVIHKILNPGDFIEDKVVGEEKVKAAFHPTTYTPFYQGEYDKDGRLLDPNDPFLYWLVPIVEEPKDAHLEPFRVALPKPGELGVKNYVRIHAEKVKTRRN